MKTSLFIVAVFVVSAAHGQGCRAPWQQYEESCYLFTDDYGAWSTAMEICRVMGGAMLEIDAMSENNYIVSQLKSKGISHAWVGLQDFAQEGTFQLISTQQNPAFTHWEDGEPNNFFMAGHEEGGEDCVIMAADTGKWDDYWCDDTHVATAVCERQ